MNIRAGIGFDVHKLAENRKLIIGGVEIPWDKGLLGHSDADVLLHAISDALLGAAALGDIGKHFPDTDGKYKDAVSTELLAEVVAILKKEGWAINNIDATIIAERPKMAPYIDGMRKIISDICFVDIASIGLKATTTETLGFTGRGEGIAAQAVCTIKK